MRMYDLQKHVGFTDSCWIWTGKLDNGGYGIYDDKKAHRIVYELCLGKIGDGLTLDHLCRVRNCVNPDHLEQVTIQDNIRRAKMIANPLLGTHCPAGHEMNESNTYIVTIRDKIQKNCRPCNAKSVKKYKSKLKALK